MDGARQSRLSVVALSAAAVLALGVYGFGNKARLDARARRHEARAASERLAIQMQDAALRSDARSLLAMLRRPDASADTIGPALLASATEGDARTVALLLDASPAARRPEARYALNAALGRACGLGYEDVARVLLARGAHADWRDSTGYPLIVRAASRGHAGVVRLLLASGADVNAAVTPATDEAVPWSPPDGLGLTPLLAASARGNPATVRLLLQHGASVDARTEDGLTALDLCRRGRLFWSGKRGGLGAVDPPARAARIRRRVAQQTNCLEVAELLRHAGCKP